MSKREILGELCLLTVVVVLGVVQLALAASSGSAKAGVEIYVQSCQICHGPTGKGDSDIAAYYLTPMPDLSANETQEKTDEELRKIILGGRGTDMWHYAGAFEEDQIDALIAYIRSLQAVSLHWPHDSMVSNVEWTMDMSHAV